MKQIVVKQGVSMAVEVAPSALQNGMVRVRVVRSCISPGTEMMGIASSGKSLLQRALEQPDKAKAAIKSMASQGVSSVLGKAKAKFGASRLPDTRRPASLLKLRMMCRVFLLETGLPWRVRSMPTMPKRPLCRSISL